MRSQVTFSRVINFTLGVMMVGLLAALPYLARPDRAQAKQTIPAADHCAGIGSDAVASTLLAANPELLTACRFAMGMAQQEAMRDAAFVNIAAPEATGLDDNVQQAREAEAARYAGLAEAYNRESGPADSHVLAENPEVMMARRYTTTPSGAGLPQENETVQRFGLAELLASERDTASSQSLTIDDIRRLDLNEFMEAVEK